MPVRYPARAPVLSLILALGLALGGCLPATVIPSTVMGAAGLYCATVSDEGKTMTREALTNGQPLIACPEPEPAPTLAP